MAEIILTMQQHVWKASSAWTCFLVLFSIQLKHSFCESRWQNIYLNVLQHRIKVTFMGLYRFKTYADTRLLNILLKIRWGMDIYLWLPSWDTFFIIQGLIQVPLTLPQHVYQHCTSVLRLRQGFLPQNIYCSSNHTVYFLLFSAFQACPALRFAPRHVRWPEKKMNRTLSCPFCYQVKCRNKTGAHLPLCAWTYLYWQWTLAKTSQSTDSIF